jgi:phosphoserine phosphatase RsbU/P
MEPERLRVLLIEHDDAFARALADMFGPARDAVAEVLIAPDLRAGLSVLAADGADVVILDFSLADGAGLGNIGLIKAEAPRVPVIVVGGVDDEAVAVAAVQGGAQDYLVRSQLNSRWLLRSIHYAVQRHRADMALLDAEEKYRGIFDHLVEGIFQTTPDGRYLMANSALARIYGYASPAELRQSVTDIARKLYVQPGRRDEFVRLMHEHDTITAFESQIFRKDGSVIWISENCRAIRDRRGNLLYYEGTVEDITQRRQAEENLRNSEVLYHSLVETLPQNIFRKDVQSRFTFANQQFCRTLGRKLEELVGKSDFDFFPAEMAEKYQRDDRRVIETGQPFEAVEEHQPPGRERIFVQVVKTPIYGGDGQIAGLQGIFWDITQQKLAEEQVHKANVELARSREELRLKNTVMEENLKMAREIQLAMLPQQYPAFPRHAAQGESALQFTHRYLPTETVGGDFFTITALSDAEAAVFICDVAGHGVRSALVTAMIRALVEELRPLAADPGQFLTKLNSDLYAILRHTGSPLLTTAFYLVANWQTGVLRFANAGHPRPLHLRRQPGGVEFLANRSGKPHPALGLWEDSVCQTSETKLSPGDLVLLFTDGLFEVESAQHDLYTEEMLSAAAQRRIQLPASELFDELLSEIQQFSVTGQFADDVCLVGMKLARPETT